MARERLGEILIKAGLLDEAGLQRALAEQRRWGGRIGKHLVSLSLVTEETLVRALSTQFRLPAVALDPPRMNAAVARLIPQEICEKHILICFKADVSKKFLDVAMADPADRNVIDEVQAATRFNVRPHVASPSAIEKAIMYVFFGDSAGIDGLELESRSKPRTDAGRARPPTGTTLKEAESRQTWSGAPAVKVPTGPRAQLESLPGVSVVESATDTASGPSPRPILPAPISIGDLRSDSGFHVTLENASVDRRNGSSTPGTGTPTMRPGDDRILQLESQLARQRVLLELLLGTLSKKGIMTKEEVQRLLSSIS